MRRIILCGSSKFKDMILQMGEDIRNMGFEVETPRGFLVDMGKREHSKIDFEAISNPETDALLIINENNGDIPNYIGANTLAEIALGFYFGKKIFLKNDIYEPYKDELEGWGVIPLRGNLEEMFKQI